MASVVAAHAAKDIPHLLPLTLSTEVGVFGGTPAGGLRFGAAVNATTAVPCSTIIDFYQGGGIDMACLGMAEVSPAWHIKAFTQGPDFVSLASSGGSDQLCLRSGLICVQVNRSGQIWHPIRMSPDV